MLHIYTMDFSAIKNEITVLNFFLEKARNWGSNIKENKTIKEKHYIFYHPQHLDLNCVCVMKVQRGP